MSTNKRTKVVGITTHFNIFRNINEANTGDVTPSEQLKAVERFIRWHERQAEVGRRLRGMILLNHPECQSDEPARTVGAVARPDGDSTT